MEYSVAVGLEHFGVDVVARVAQLRDLLGQQLHTLHRVAEDDGLVDLKLRGAMVLVSCERGGLVDVKHEDG